MLNIHSVANNSNNSYDILDLVKLIKSELREEIMVVGPTLKLESLTPPIPT